MLKYLKKLAGSPDRDDFARLMIESFRAAGVAGEINYDRDSFRLLLQGERQIFLNNAHQDYCRAGRRAKSDVLRQYAIVDIPSIPSSWEEASQSLLPVVREGSFFTQGTLRAQAAGKEAKKMAFRPVASHLAVGLAHDGPKTISYVMHDSLEAWAVSLDDALDHAGERLWKMSNGRFERSSAGFYISPWRDNYDASRLFLPQLLWNLNVKGDHIAAIPTRDYLVITGSEDTEGLSAMAQMCEQASEMAHAVSGVPVILNGKEWATYWPEPEHPLSSTFRRLRVLDHGRSYAEQKQLLDKWHERTGEDIFVASYTIMENKKTKELSSYAVWSEGILTLLPEAESILFVRSDKSIVGKAAWNLVVQTCGDLMSRTDLLPIRYKVEA
ncbi:MAG: DUF1444 family protein, partial [Blastocatellia bacterium]